MECGTAAPGALGTRVPGWRSTATILAATAILAIGAATAAYAALNKETSQPTATVVRSPGALASTPAVPTTAQVPPPTTGTASTPTASTPLPTPTSKPPKIPVAAPTPTTAAKAAPPSTTTKSTPPAIPPVATTPAPTTPAPTAIVLDTNAVSTYNPNGYPATDFGEPSLTIDGETSTAWTSPVFPEIAPKMAVGLLVDLRALQKLASMELISATPGMTVQVFGASGSTAPANVTDAGWVKLSKALVNKNRHQSIKLGDSSKGFRYVLLWISAAPASAVGTPQAPGTVKVNEIELFAAK